MKKKKLILSIVISIIVLSIFGGGYAIKYFLIDTGKINLEKINVLANISTKNRNLIDDWRYSANASSANSVKSSIISGGYSLSTNSFGSYSPNISMATDSIAESASNSTLGLSTGGAKNINNFRENIKNGYFPISTDITYNGLYYDYYFDTGKSEGIGKTVKSTELFSPSYSTAVSKDPISGAYEYYMTVGLNSNIKESDLQKASAQG